MSALTNLHARLSERIERVAGGSFPPAGAEPDALVERRPSARERGAMRRRLRVLRRRREAVLLELGALAFELHRRNRQKPELVRRKAATLTALESEAEALAAALETSVPMVERPAAPGDRECSQCAAALAADWAFCARCGARLSGPSAASPPPAAESAPAAGLRGR